MNGFYDNSEPGDDYTKEQVAYSLYLDDCIDKPKSYKEWFETEWEGGGAGHEYD